MQGSSSKLYVFLLTLAAGVLMSSALWVGAQDTQPPATTSPNAESGAPAAQTPVAPDEVVMTIGDMKITAKDFEAIAQGLPPEAASALATMGKKGFAERYANLLSLAKEGEKRKVDESAIFKQMVTFQRTMLLAQLTVNELLANMPAISAEEVNYYYISHQPDFQQVKLRGIYVPFSSDADTGKPAPGADAKSKQPAAKSGKQLTEAEAKAKADALRHRIRGGEKMEALAKKESDHPTAAKGGDFGFVRHGQFAPQIDSVIFALEPNQVSIPVRDRFGFFIFQVEEKRVQPLQEAQATIENGLRQQKVGEELTKVQTQYPVTYNPRFFNDQPPLGMPGSQPGQPAPGARPAPAK